MNIEIREYRGGDVAEMVRIWNEVVEDGVAFPQEEYLTDLTGSEFFPHRLIPPLRQTPTRAACWDFTSFTRTT